MVDQTVEGWILEAVPGVADPLALDLAVAASEVVVLTSRVGAALRQQRVLALSARPAPPEGPRGQGQPWGLRMGSVGARGPSKQGGELSVVLLEEWHSLGAVPLPWG